MSNSTSTLINVTAANPWSKLKILPSPGAQCTHLIPPFVYAAVASDRDIYIVGSPNQCSSCKSQACDLRVLSTHDGTLTPIETSGAKFQNLLVNEYISGTPGDGKGLIVFAPGLDAFSLDLGTKEWKHLEVQGPAPSPRSWPSIVMVGSKFFIFGGVSSVSVNDLWVLDFGPSTNEPSWTLVEPSTSIKPCPRYAHKCISYGRCLVIFGGYDSGFLNDTWCYDTETRVWSELQCTGTIPSPRHVFSMVLIGDIAYVFGGHGGGVFGDLWALDIPHRRWFALNEGQNPEPRWHHSMILVDQKIYIFGGHSSSHDKNVVDVLDTSLISHPELRERSRVINPQQPNLLPSPQYDEFDLSSHADPPGVSSLLAILQKPGNAVRSVVNAETVDLTRKLLAMNSPISLASQLDTALDMEVLIEFLLHLIDNGRLLDPTLPDANRKARRLILRIVAQYEWPVIPKAVLVPEIGSRQKGTGDVLRGDLQGKAVVLRLLPVALQKGFYQKLLAWRALHHEHILALLGIYVTRSPRKARYLVIPETVNGTLSEWRKGRSVIASKIQQLILQVGRGIQYLHWEGIIHGDLRGSNVVLDQDFNCKVCIFGMMQPSGSVSRGSPVISPNFAAPELFGDLGVDDDLSESNTDSQTAARTEKSDVYAFACLYYEIHFDAMPFGGITYEELVTLVVKDKTHPKRLETPALSDEGWKLMRRCWRPELRRRPTMETVAESMAAWGDD